MNKRDLFSELMSALSDAKNHDLGELTLRSHNIGLPKKLSLSPGEIKEIRTIYNMSRAIFARYLHTSSRTLENWEQGRSKPNDQAITLLHLVKHHPEILRHIASL